MTSENISIPTLFFSGGSTLFPGSRERLGQEMRQLARSSITVRVVAAKDHNHSLWSGGSLIASVPGLKILSISKEEYEESGPSIVHRKCS